MHGLPDDARCLTCGYALRGQTEPRCPECGRAFDPDDTDTFRLPARCTWTRRHCGPLGRWHVVLTLLGTACFLYGQSEPGGVLAFAFCGGCVFAVALPLLLIGNYLFHALCTIIHRGLPTARQYRRRWLVLPLALVLALSTVPFNWVFAARFALSCSALEAEVQRLIALPPRDPNCAYDVPQGPTIVGQYLITGRLVRRNPTGGVDYVELLTFGWARFRYSPASVTSHPRGLLPPGWEISINEK